MFKKFKNFKENKVVDGFIMNRLIIFNKFEIIQSI
jgi:hypothetical protein